MVRVTALGQETKPRAIYHRNILTDEGTAASKARMEGEAHLRMTFSRNSAPFSRARRYSSLASYRAVTSTRLRRISASSASIALISSSSACTALFVGGRPGSGGTSAPSQRPSSVVDLRCPPAEASDSATVASGRWFALLERFTLELLAML